MSTIVVPTTDQLDRPMTHGYDGSIDNVLIRLAVGSDTPLENMTADAAPPKVDSAEGAEDIRDETGQRYSRSNLSGGAGLDFLHSPGRPDDAALRFWDSKGVDVFDTDRGEAYTAKLLHRVDELRVATGIVDVVEVRGEVFYLDGSTIYNEAGTSEIVLAAAGIKLVGMGNMCYSLDGTDGVESYVTSAGTWAATNVSPTIFDNIWGVKSRILGAIDDDLFEALPAGSEAVLISTSVGDTWVDVIDVGEYVLAFSTSGTIHILGIDPSDGVTLIALGESSWIDETPIMAAASFGTVGVATTEPTVAGGTVTRFYTLEVADAAVRNVQLVYQIGDRDTTTDLSPHAIVASRDSIFLAVPEEGETEITFWRYYTPTGGYARAQSVDAGVARTVLSAAHVDDRLWIAVGAEGLWRETDEYVVKGWLIGPLADFYTAEEKQWISGELSGTKLPSGCSLELYDETDPTFLNQTDSSLWMYVDKLPLSTASTVERQLSGRSARYHTAMVVLRSDASRILSPGFRSYSFRVLPNPKRDRLYRIPINVSDQVETFGRRALHVRGRGQATEDRLRPYEGQYVVIELFREGLEMWGMVEKFEDTMETFPDRGSLRRVMYARIRGTLVVDDGNTGAVSSGLSLGQNTLGLSSLGVGGTI